MVIKSLVIHGLKK